jgi:hypothetical protein
MSFDTSFVNISRYNKINSSQRVQKGKNVTDKINRISRISSSYGKWKSTKSEEGQIKSIGNQSYQVVMAS